MAEQKLDKSCLYEVIGVNTTSSPDEIRSAFRRLALQLHPDKVAAANGGIITPSHTAAFQELLHAYEILSNPKERAYYDKHRIPDRKHRPPDSSTRKSHPDKSHKPPPSTKSHKYYFSTDFHSYFTNSAFAGFSDTEHGFYRVYGDLFAKLYTEELKHRSTSIPPAPKMGNIDGPYSHVKAFYKYWLSFCTVQDFGWVDEFGAANCRNLQVRSLKEEENIKARKKARKDYNDFVRCVAAFAKKRDKRVIERKRRKKMEDERRREEKAQRKEEEIRGKGRD